MLRRRTTLRHYIEIQQTLDKLERLQSEHRDLYIGAQLSPLGHELDLRYQGLKHLGRLPQEAPVALTWLEGLTLAVVCLCVGFVGPLVIDFVRTITLH